MDVFFKEPWNHQNRLPMAEWLTNELQDDTRLHMLGNVVVPAQAFAAMCIFHHLLQMYGKGCDPK